MNAACRKQLSAFKSLQRTSLLLIASMALVLWEPEAVMSGEFERTHENEIQLMVSASVRVETGIDALRDEFAKKTLSTPDRNSPPLLSERQLNRECSNFVHAIFYAKYKALLEKIDTSPLDTTSVFALRKNRSDRSVLRDPRKIAIETKYIISGFEFLKDFHPPLEDFVVQYAARPDLEEKCTRYLNATGIRN